MYRYKNQNVNKLLSVLIRDSIPAGPCDTRRLASY